MEADSDEFPGATIIWYGKHKDTKRIDELEDSYCRGLLKGHRENPQNPNFSRFEKLYAKYISTHRSPMSYKIWFGEYKGHEMRKIYKSNRWKYLLRSDSDIKDMLLWIEERYFEWRELHPERSVGTQRAQHVIINRVGEKLGSWTDLDHEQDDDYDSDDGFVVKDDDSDMSDNTEDEDESSLPEIEADIGRDSEEDKHPLECEKSNSGDGPDGLEDVEHNTQPNSDEHKMDISTSFLINTHLKAATLKKNCQGGSQYESEDDSDEVISPLNRRPTRKILAVNKKIDAIAIDTSDKSKKVADSGDGSSEESFPGLNEVLAERPRSISATRHSNCSSVKAIKTNFASSKGIRSDSDSDDVVLILPQPKKQASHELLENKVGSGSTKRKRLRPRFSQTNFGDESMASASKQRKKSRQPE